MVFIGNRDQKFAIICNDESSNSLLSNERTAEIWNTLDELIATLLKSSAFAPEASLFAWKKESRHLASPREPYAWRAAIEEIKNSELTSMCQDFRGDAEKFVLITDKPAMLKIAGEITSSLLHSYTSRHRISFVPV